MRYVSDVHAALAACYEAEVIERFDTAIRFGRLDIYLGNSSIQSAQVTRLSPPLDDRPDEVAN